MGSNPTDPEKKTDLRKVFQAQLQRMVEYTEQEDTSARLQDTPIFYMPKCDPGGEDGKWEGSLFDIDGMKKAFSRKEHEKDFSDSVKDGKSAGRVGDLMLIQLQGDWLAAAERAFRARHHTHIRAMTHAAARRLGHSNTNGVLKGGQKKYLEWILRQTSQDNPAAVPTNKESEPPWPDAE